MSARAELQLQLLSTPCVTSCSMSPASLLENYSQNCKKYIKEAPCTAPGTEWGQYGLLVPCFSHEFN